MVIIGSGIRGSKLALPAARVAELPAAEVIDELAAVDRLSSRTRRRRTSPTTRRPRSTRGGGGGDPRAGRRHQPPGAAEAGHALAGGRPGPGVLGEGVGRVAIDRQFARAVRGGERAELRRDAGDAGRQRRGRRDRRPERQAGRRAGGRAAGLVAGQDVDRLAGRCRPGSCRAARTRSLIGTGGGAGRRRPAADVAAARGAAPRPPSRSPTTPELLPQAARTAAAAARASGARPRVIFVHHVSSWVGVHTKHDARRRAVHRPSQWPSVGCATHSGKDRVRSGVEQTVYEQRAGDHRPATDTGKEASHEEPNRTADAGPSRAAGIRAGTRDGRPVDAAGTDRRRRAPGRRSASQRLSSAGRRELPAGSTAAIGRRRRATPAPRGRGPRDGDSIGPPAALGQHRGQQHRRRHSRRRRRRDDRQAPEPGTARPARPGRPATSAGARSTNCRSCSASWSSNPDRSSDWAQP